MRAAREVGSAGIGCVLVHLWTVVRGERVGVFRFKGDETEGPPVLAPLEEELGTGGLPALPVSGT